MKTINILMVLIIIVFPNGILSLTGLTAVRNNILQGTAMVLSINSLIANTNGDEEIGGQIKVPCDLTNRAKGLECESCNKMQNGFQCTKCVLSENDLQEEVKEGVSIINDTNDHKKYYIAIDFNEDGFIIDECPRCQGRNFVKVDYLTPDKTCGKCNKKPTKEIEFCVKSEYYCPMHVDFKTLKPGVCAQTISEGKDKTKKCGKQLNERKIYAPIFYAYECPKCHQQDDNPDKCETCGQNKTKKAVCKNSGTFPHVNQAEWEKNAKVEQKPSAVAEKVIIKAYLPLAVSCHQKTVNVLNGLVKEYKEHVFVECIDFSTKEGQERTKKDLGKVCATIMINGKQTYTIKDENGKEREVTFSGPIDNQYTTNDIKAVVKLLLGK